MKAQVFVLYASSSFLHPPDTSPLPCRCLFPAAAGYGSCNRVTNPHEFDIDGLHLLGTSGQNVDDLAKYSRQTDR